MATHPGCIVRPAWYRLLRFSGALDHDAAVARWFDERPGELGSIARRWFARMRSCGGDVRELVPDGCPVACVNDAPFGYVNVFRAHVNIGFFHGAALADPAGLMQGHGKYMRHVKLRPGAAVDASSLGDVIAAAYLDIGVRLKSDPSSQGFPVSLPVDPGRHRSS